MHPRVRNLLLATTALVAARRCAPAAGQPAGPGRQVVGGAATVHGTGTANVTVTQSSQNADHQLEHVQHRRRRDDPVRPAELARRSCSTA